MARNHTETVVHFSLCLYMCPPATVCLGRNNDEEMITSAFGSFLLQLLPSNKERHALVLILSGREYVPVFVPICVRACICLCICIQL